MKKQFALYTLAVLFLMASVTFGQEYPKFEVPVGFSFVNVHLDLAPITSFSTYSVVGADLSITSRPSSASKPISPAAPKAVG